MSPTSTPRPPRRPRYRGTHPRRFDERYKERHPQKYPGIEAHIRDQGRTPAGSHVPILVEEVMRALDPKPGEIIADCTLGHGGHALEFMKRIGPAGRLVGLDVDGAELERAGQRLAGTGVPASYHRSHFAGIGKVMAREGLDGYDVIFADLGASSMQIDDPERGFSYKHDGPLDMRMDDRLKRTAADILREVPEADLSDVLRELGDEPDHGRIARKVVNRRQSRPLERTSDLVRLVFEAKRIDPGEWSAGREGRPGPHPAAPTFQVLRILVNGEMSQLEELLRVAPYCLKPGGRFGIISFHSGEDGRVIAALRDGVSRGLYRGDPERSIRPSPAERRDNPRSRSAVFRWVDRVEGPAAG